MWTHPKVGLVVPTFEYLNGNWQPSFGAFPTIWNAVEALLGIRDLRVLFYFWVHKWARSALKPQRVDYGEGAGLLIRDAVRRAIGGLLTEYFAYGEDLDYCFRAAKAGWRTWWVPGARLTHVRGASLARKDPENGRKVKFLALTRFLVRNYSLVEARVVFILWCLNLQRMLLAIQLGTAIPGLKEQFGDRLTAYRVVRDLYWHHLPWERFQALLSEIS